MTDSRIIIEIDSSLDKDVKKELFEHINSLCNLLQGDNHILDVRLEND